MHMLISTLINVVDTSEPDYVYEAEYVVPPISQNPGRKQRKYRILH